MSNFAEVLSSAGSKPAATVAIAAALTSAALLLALHFVSPEFAPSWRMVSEYANGRHAGLLTGVFATWAISSWALAVAVWPISSSWLGRIGLAFLVLAGIGEMMGGLFDVNHRLHGAAFGIGVPSLTIAALLVTLALRRAGVEAPLWPAHLNWIAVVLMALTMALFFAALRRAGVEISTQSTPLSSLPDGVRAYNGWANRLLFAASYLWLVLTAMAARAR
jgi:hypothetical protein